MRSVIIWAFVLLSGALQADDAADLARAAKSPYLLKRYIESHVDINLDSLWTTVPSAESLVVHCESEPCRTELVAVQADRQVILVVNSPDRYVQAYLRFQRRDRAQPWRITCVDSAGVKYFPPRHRLIHFGNKHVFCGTGQGAAGSGLSTEWESCYDLAAEDFEPAFEYSPKGSYWTAFGLIAEWTGTLVTMEAGPVETLRIRERTRFLGMEGGSKWPLGERVDTLIYTRKAGAREFKLDDTRSTMSYKDVTALFENVEFDFGDFLRWDLPALKRIAVGPD